jgi:hypothetical protein
MVKELKDRLVKMCVSVGKTFLTKAHLYLPPPLGIAPLTFVVIDAYQQVVGGTQSELRTVIFFRAGFRLTWRSKYRKGRVRHEFCHPLLGLVYILTCCVREPEADLEVLRRNI